jgi:hypothetical protein
MEPEKLYELKKKYGSVFQATVKGTEIVFRELTFSEYDKIAEYQNSDDYSSVDTEDIIIECAVVYPENFNINKIPPGMVTSLAQEIIDFSGFNSAKLAKRILEDKRDHANQVRSLMKAFVLATITSYSPEQLDDMTFSQLAEKVALSEKIIEIQQGINGVQSTDLRLELIDPEEEVEKQKQKAARHNLSKKEGEAEYDDPIAQKLWGMR